MYHPSILQVEKYYASDPYARGLSSFGRRMYFESNTLKLEGWDDLANQKPVIFFERMRATDEEILGQFQANYIHF